MPRKGTGLAGQVEALVRGGGVVTLDEATAAVFGQDATKQDRERVRWAVNDGVFRRRLARAGRGSYRLAPVAAPDDPKAETTTPDPVEAPVPAPPTPAHATVAHQLNLLAMTVNATHAAIHERISETRRAINMIETVTTDEAERPTGFRLTRYASTTTTVTVSKAGPHRARTTR